jgi:hypothetical protein
MVMDTTIKLSKEFKEIMKKDMKKDETYEDYIKKFIKGKKKYE